MNRAKLLCILQVLTINYLVAQRFPDRWLTINPLMNQQDAVEDHAWSWMHSTVGWGEFGGYRIVRDKEHAWIQRLGTFVELLRIGDASSLAFLSSIEFIANPDNDIRFNPRAVFWDEGFLWTQRAGSSYWQLGYFHRCKHDVDNFILRRERSLIFGSLQAKYLLPLDFQEARTQSLLALRMDLYTIRQDDRFPSEFANQFPHVKRMLATIGGTLHVRKSLATKPLGLYATYWSAVNLYGSKESVLLRWDTIKQMTFQGGLAGGIAIEGNTHLRIGFTYEYLSDTGINPTPESAHLVTLGVTIVNPSAMW